MAARAGIRFSTRGAGQTVGKVRGVGAAFGGLGKSSKSASFGIGRVAYRLYNTLARISMVRRGVSGMSREIKGAENKWRGWGRAMGGPFTSVLAGLSKKFAEVRRTIAFYILAVKDYVRWGKKMTGVQKAISKGVPSKGVGKAVDEAPPVKPPPSGIIARFGKLGGAYRVVATAAKILTGAVIALTVALTALYTYIAYKTAKMALGVVKGFMSIRETFRKYEISLGGIVRNTTATAKIMKFAVKYAAEYPAMFEDVIDAFRGLASMPTLKPLFRKADYDDLKGIMDIVQGLATLKPQQGVQGAMMALREALSGQMRSLRMRFEVNVREMADAAGFSFGEITHDANKALIAIRKFVELNVPAEAMASMAKTIEVQWGNVYDKYRTFVNQMMKSTGAYWAVVKALERLNEWFEKVFAAPEVVGFGQKVGNALREIVSIFEAAMVGFDWRGYLERGDLVGAVRDLCERIKILFKVLWEEFGEEAKKALNTVIALLKDILKPAFAVIASSFWKMIEAGAADAGRITGKLFGIAFKGTVKAASKGVWKKLTTLERPLRDWGPKPKIEAPEAEKRGLKTEKPLDYIGQKVKTAADFWESKVKTAADFWESKVKTAAEEPKKKGLLDKLDELTGLDKVAKWISGQAAKLEEPLKKLIGEKVPEVKKREEGAEVPLQDRLRRQAKAMREKVRVPKPEPVETGEDIPLKIDKKALEALKKQREIKEALAKTESKINRLKSQRGKNTQQLIDLEVQLLNFVIEEHKAEEQLVEIANRRKQNERDIVELKRYGSATVKEIAALEKDLADLVVKKLGTEIQMGKAGSSQKKIKEQIFKIEEQITKKHAKIVELQEGNIRGLNAIIKLETESIDLTKEKLDTEQKIAKALVGQKKLKEKILEVEKKGKKEGKKEEKKATVIGVFDKALWGLNKLDKATTHFLRFFKEGMKEGAGALSHIKVPGMEKMTWGQAVAGGIPKFFKKQEEILKEKLTKAFAPAAKKTILEKLYDLNITQFGLATTPGAKAVQFIEANKIMEQLLDAEVDYHNRSMKMRQSLVYQIGRSNQLLEAISIGVGNTFKGGSPFTVSESDWGNEKIRGANPKTTPALVV